MKKLNNNGHMLVEIILAASISIFVAYILINITVKIININNNKYIEGILTTDKNVITKEVMDDINLYQIKKIEIINDTNVKFIYANNLEKKLEIDKNNKIIKYESYERKLSDYVIIDSIKITNNNGLFLLDIPIYTNYSKENYGIRISISYSLNSDLEIVLPM